MSDENKGVNPGEGTPAGNPPAPSNPPAATDKPESGVTDPAPAGEKRVVDAERFNELLAASKKADALEEAMKQKDQEMAQWKQQMAEVLTGKKPSEVEAKVKGLSDKWGVPEGFVKDLLEETSAVTSKNVQSQLAPVHQMNLQTIFNEEFQKLTDEFPEARDMSTEERNELKKLAFSDQFSRVPLSDIYKIRNYGKPPAVHKSVESGNGRGRNFGTDVPNISEMTLEQFKEYSDGLAKK